jgi:hypothetical protein
MIILYAQEEDIVFNKIFAVVQLDGQVTFVTDQRSTNLISIISAGSKQYVK